MHHCVKSLYLCSHQWWHRAVTKQQVQTSWLAHHNDINVIVFRKKKKKGKRAVIHLHVWSYSQNWLYNRPQICTFVLRGSNYKLNCYFVKKKKKGKWVSWIRLTRGGSRPQRTLLVCAKRRLTSHHTLILTIYRHKANASETMATLDQLSPQARTSCTVLLRQLQNWNECVTLSGHTHRETRLLYVSLCIYTALFIGYWDQSWAERPDHTCCTFNYLNSQ